MTFLDATNKIEVCKQYNKLEYIYLIILRWKSQNFTKHYLK
jgi:hypothetical protein